MDKNEALLCANVAWSAYGGDSQIKNFRLTARFENKGTDTQGIFGEIGSNTLVIAFRGSEETGIWDWITDLKFVQQVYPYGEAKDSQVRVHYGFISAYQSVRDAVLTQVKSSPHRRIICVGHSLGGALATLCALDVQYNFPDRQVSCYTFGSPKVGNSYFKDSYNKRVAQTFRFVNSGDTVPSLPPGGFEHVGLLQQIGQTSLSTAVESFFDKVIDIVDDHFPNNYIKSLQEFLKD